MYGYMVEVWALHSSSQNNINYKLYKNKNDNGIIDYVIGILRIAMLFITLLCFREYILSFSLSLKHINCYTIIWSTKKKMNECSYHALIRAVIPFSFEGDIFIVIVRDPFL